MINTMILLDESIQNYLSWLKNIKKAPYHTYRAYQVDLTQFLKYFLNLEINEIPSKDAIEEYLGKVQNKYNYASYRRKITVLRNFIRYLVDSGINVPDPFIFISLPMPEINFNLPAKHEDVLNLIELLPEDDLKNIRNKLIFSLIAKSGLTIKQLLSLKVKDINLASGQIIISKEQLTFLDKKTINLIEKYFLILNKKTQVSLDDYLISSRVLPWQDLKNSRLPLSTRSINLIIDKTAKEMDFKFRLSPSILRRLFAKSLSEKNINKATKEMILGKKCRLVG
ncbi:MAG: tyrosine-type recombinase/integrase [Candidatus Melainabacteria bacterium]|nr:tyrosine-type recombinase/integrase [Candidatus Melainabacteria bacterium]